VEWLAAQGIRRVGDRVRLELRELDVDGLFQVMAIKACPEIAAGPGRVVTAVFSASRGAVWNLGIAGESAPIGVTEQHPFWSADRHDWVPAGKLRRGERVLVAGGTAANTSWERAGDDAVYNIEVEGDHCYRFGEQGILVHNASVVPDTEIAHRIAGGEASNLALKPGEAILAPPGISVLLGGTAAEAAAAFRAVFGPKTSLGKKDLPKIVGTAQLAAIRALCFDVIADKTNNFPNHGRLIHPTLGAAGFSPDNLLLLSQVFTNTTGL